MWDESTFYLVPSSCGDFSVTCILQMDDGSFTWAFSGVCCLQGRIDKLKLWDDMHGIRDGWFGSWCMRKFCIVMEEVYGFVLLI